MSNLGEEIAAEPMVDVLSVSAVETQTDLESVAIDEAGLGGIPQSIGWSYFRQGLATGAPLLAGDCLAVCGSVLLGSLTVSLFFPETQYLVLSLARQLVATVGLTLLIFSAFGLYPGTGLNAIFEFRHCVTAAVLVFGGMLLGNAVFGRLVLYEIWLFGSGLLVAVIAVPVLRTFVRSLCSRFNWWGQPLLVIGNGESAVSIFKSLQQYPTTGLRPIGIVGDIGSHWRDETSEPQFFLGDLSELASLTVRHRTHWAVVTGSTLTEGAVDTTEISIPHLLVIPELQGLPSLWNQTQDHDRQAAIHVQARLLLPLPRVIKRGTDLLLVIVGGLFVLPLMGILVLLIKVASPGPAFYGHERIGLHGRKFLAWKFRTMFVNADQVLDKYLEKHSELRDEWERDHKLKSDPRVIPYAGTFLRKTSLDELPQIWNVLWGEMSLVGPRPIVAAEIPKYDKRYALYLRVRPGITGLWQVSGRNNTTYSERVSIDTYYIRNWSPWLDAFILAKTIKVVLLRDGAY